MRASQFLLATASVAALSAGVALAAGLPIASVSGDTGSFPIRSGAKILYDQNSNDAGYRIIAQNLTSGYTTGAYWNQAADDFVVPKGHIWRIRRVDVTGWYFSDGSRPAKSAGPATSESVVFYRNNKGTPGAIVRNGAFISLHGTESNGSFAIALPRNGLRLQAGTYWVSVVINMSFVQGGFWGWEVNSVRHGHEAVWQNEGDGFGTGCTTWETLENCWHVGPDFMFDLSGKIVE